MPIDGRSGREVAPTTPPPPSPALVDRSCEPKSVNMHNTHCSQKIQQLIASSLFIVWQFEKNHKANDFLLSSLKNLYHLFMKHRSIVL